MNVPADTPDSRRTAGEGVASLRPTAQSVISIALALVLLIVMYRRTAYDLYINWTMADSYYTHGFLVPLISLYFAWQKREQLLATPVSPSAVGLLWIGLASALFVIGQFLGFRVFSQLSIVPMLTGLIIATAGTRWARILWFPQAFLLFMVPIPPSMTQNIALQLKLFAAHCAVLLANLLTLPMVREGSYVYFGTDRLLVGDICGGLRSLISLLALGAIAAYLNPGRVWARVLILLLSGPIAIAANLVRIFFLCVVGYFYGSEVAAGKVHDYSGVLIFAVAIGLFCMIDIPLRWWAGSPKATAGAPPASPHRPSSPRARMRILAGVLALLVFTTLLHVRIARAQASAHMNAPAPATLNIPPVIADYRQIGSDYEIDPRTQEILETSTILIRNYMSESGRSVQLSIVHAGATRRSLHFPEVCLVGEGWEIVKQETGSVGILFTARRILLVKGNRYEAVLYWFKTGDYITGSYFANAYQWTKNQVTLGEPTSSMIKLTTPVGANGERAAFAALDDFAAKFAPIMRERIP